MHALLLLLASALCESGDISLSAFSPGGDKVIERLHTHRPSSRYDEEASSFIISEQSEDSKRGFHM